MRSVHSCRAGYTLIEVLVALVVIALVVPVAMRGVSLATALGSRSRQRAQAATLAKLKLDELAATGTWRTGELNGDFGADHPGYRWAATVASWGDGSVRELDLQVTWTGSRGSVTGGEQSTTLSTLVRAEGP